MPYFEAFNLRVNLYSNRAESFAHRFQFGKSPTSLTAARKITFGVKISFKSFLLAC